MGCATGTAHFSHQYLWHELQVYAGAKLALRLSSRGCFNHARLPETAQYIATSGLDVARSVRAVR